MLQYSGLFSWGADFRYITSDPGASMWPCTCKGGLSNLAGYADVHDMTCSYQLVKIKKNVDGGTQTHPGVDVGYTPSLKLNGKPKQ